MAEEIAVITLSQAAEKAKRLAGWPEELKILSYSPMSFAAYSALSPVFLRARRLSAGQVWGVAAEVVRDYQLQYPVWRRVFALYMFGASSRPLAHRRRAITSR